MTLQDGALSLIGRLSCPANQLGGRVSDNRMAVMMMMMMVMKLEDDDADGGNDGDEDDFLSSGHSDDDDEGRRCRGRPARRKPPCA